MIDMMRASPLPIEKHQFSAATLVAVEDLRN